MCIPLGVQWHCPPTKSNLYGQFFKTVIREPTLYKLLPKVEGFDIIYEVFLL
jgi:hypothetical protein